MAELGLDLAKVHDYTVDKQHRAKMMQVRPALRLHRGVRPKHNERGEQVAEEQDPPVFIQGGVFYSAGGDKLTKEDLPKWLDEEIKKSNPLALAEAGIDPREYGLRMPTRTRKRTIEETVAALSDDEPTEKG